MKFKNRENFQPTKEQLKLIDDELVLFDKEPSYNEIIDNIYVGNYKFALDANLMIKEGITHILNFGNGLKNFYEKDNIFKYLYIPLYDSESKKLEKYLEKSNNFIKEGSENNNKILIHCGAGMSRSVTLCLMYMIMEKKYKFSEAYKIIKEKRKCAIPNSGFRKLLEQKSYELYKEF